MEPFMSVIADINVMLRDFFRMTSKRCPRLVIAPHVIWILIALSSPVAATSIVSVVDNRNHVIVIAADDMERRRNTNKTSIVCKILAWPSCVVALSGQATEEAIAFNLWKIATSACQEPGTLRQKADYFIQIAQPEMSKLVVLLRAIDPQKFVKIVNGVPVVDLVFIGIEEGRLRMLTRGFNVINGRIVPFFHENDPTTKDVQLVAAGNTDAIISYVNQHPEWIRTPDISQFAPMLVDLEIKATPSDVGPPISVLEIGQSMMRPNIPILRWINHGACK
jgi:hypothetical protein